MSISPRTEDLRDVGWQVGATLPDQRENGDSFVDGVDHASVVDGDTLTGYVWFGGWQQIWQVARVTEGTLGAVAEAVAALAGTVTSGGGLSAEAAAVAALSGTVASTGTLSAEAAAIAALTGQVGQTAEGTLSAEAAAVAALSGQVVVSGQLGAEAAAVAALTGTAEAAAFAPDDISGLGVWLDASDLSGTHTDQDPVSGWDNNADTETFGTPADDPTYVEVDGVSGVKFVGNDHMDGTVSRTLKPTTVFLVVNPSSVTSFRALFAGQGGTGQLSLRSRSDNLLDMVADHVALVGTTDLTLGTGLKLVDVSYSASGDWVVGIDHVEDSGTGNQTITARPVRLAAAHDGDNDWLGVKHGVLVYDSVLSSGDKADVRAYLADQWVGSALPHTETFERAHTFGLFRWMGRDGGFAYSNPADGGVTNPYTATQKSDLDATRTADKATDHSTDELTGSTHTTNNSTGQWWQADFGGNRVEVDHYAILGRSDADQLLRNWKLQGSQDAAAWTDLDTQTANTDIGAVNWFDGAVANGTAWRYLRILQTGANSDGEDYLTLGEVEFWGTIQEA